MLRNQKRSPVPSADGYLGDLVAWTFGDAAAGKEFSVGRYKVEDIFKEHGFDPKDLLLSGGIGRMLTLAPRSGGILPGKNLMVKELARPNKDTPVALGVYLRNPGSESGDGWEMGARVRIHNGVAVAMPPEGQQLSEPNCCVLAGQIADRANHLDDYVCNQELSGAIVRAGRECAWAQFRRGTGGAYWVPPHTAERFRGLLDALEKFGGFWPIVQPLFGDDEGRTSANVHAAALESLKSELEEVSADLEKADELKKKTLEARVDRCREIVIRANLYAQALRADLPKIVSAIEAVSGKYASLLDYSSELAAFDTAVGQ